MKKPKLFIGMEETNIAEFVSPCCKAALSIEPLCRLTCGVCGGAVTDRHAIYVGRSSTNVTTTKPRP